MSAKGKITQVDGHVITIVTDSDRWRLDELVAVKRGNVRSIHQNSLYWLFLSWLIRPSGGNLTDQGHFDPEGLHLSLKRHFLSEKTLSKGVFKIIETGSTTQLNCVEFTEYIEKVDQFVVEFFGVDTSVFWELYGERREG